MGVPAAKVTESLTSARDEMAYAVNTLMRDGDDIYQAGRDVIPELVIMAMQLRELVKPD